ncbi:MAG: glycosyltransferase [Candidatus Helarchaeota archaeon]
MQNNNLKNILFIYLKTFNLSSPGSIRTFEISRGLVKHNVLPIILTSNYDLKLLKKQRVLLNEMLKHDIHIEHTRVLKKIFNATLFIKFYTIIDFFISWLIFAFISARSIVKKYKIQLIYCTAPSFSSFLLGYILKKIYHIPHIIEYRDPWSFNQCLDIGIIDHLQYRILFPIIEKRILKASDLVITTTNALKAHIIKTFSIRKNKIYSLRNGINLIDCDSGNFKEKSQIRIIYTGSLYSVTGIEPLFELLAMLKKDKILNELSLKLDFYGDHLNNKNLQNLIEKYEIHDFISLKGFIPRLECLKRIKEATLALTIGENFILPSINFKIWDYLSTGKKILYMGKKEAPSAKFLKKYNFGYIIPIYNKDLGVKEFKQLLLKLKNGEIKTFIPKKDLIPFSWDIQIQKLVKIIKLLFLN